MPVAGIRICSVENDKDIPPRGRSAAAMDFWSYPPSVFAAQSCSAIHPDGAADASLSGRFDYRGECLGGG